MVGATGAVGPILPQATPAGAMLDDPVEEGLFKADIVAGLLAFDPFVTENFLPLRQELLVEGGFLKQIVVARFRSVRHKVHQIEGKRLVLSNGINQLNHKSTIKR